MSDPAPKPAPRGPAPRLWRVAYRDMVNAAWTGDDPWLVTIPGGPGDVREVRRPRATPFPDTRGGRPLADDLSHIAHLEAKRYAGHRHLVVPEGSRPWFRQQTDLRNHLVGSYRTLVDEPGAGTVFDLVRRPAAGTRSLGAAIDELAASLHGAPAVLNCTQSALAGELPDMAVFAPPAGARLPYLDHSVDVVVVDPGGNLREALRVAALGVITVAPDATGPVVRSVDGVGTTGGSPPPRVLVWSSAVPDPRWEPALAERIEQVGAQLLVAPIDNRAFDGFADHDVVLALEPHVLPLPGTINAAAALAAADPTAAVTGKVLRADGRLESAGGTVFFDRSVALIAASSPSVRAPWHEYTRPVCWAPGIVAAAASLWGTVPGSPVLAGRAFIREWCAGLWSRGNAVVYHPDLAAVRVDGDGGEPSIPLEASAWQRVLDLRPGRPAELSDGTWRYLLAHDDVEACRG
jgi:hypothetical protein